MFVGSEGRACAARGGGCGGGERQLQLGIASGNLVILCRCCGGELLDYGVSYWRSSVQGAKMPAKLLHKGLRGALASDRTRHGEGSGDVDLYSGGRSAKHVASPRCHSCFAFKILMEGEVEFMPILQCLLGGELAVRLGPLAP